MAIGPINPGSPTSVSSDIPVPDLSLSILGPSPTMLVRAADLLSTQLQMLNNDAKLQAMFTDLNALVGGLSTTVQGILARLPSSGYYVAEQWIFAPSSGDQALTTDGNWYTWPTCSALRLHPANGDILIAHLFATFGLIGGGTVSSKVQMQFASGSPTDISNSAMSFAATGSQSTVLYTGFNSTPAYVDVWGSYSSNSTGSFLSDKSRMLVQILRPFSV